MKLTNIRGMTSCPNIFGRTYTVVRDAPKIGRNEPCHCGSGKKYKKCCGPKDDKIKVATSDPFIQRYLGQKYKEEKENARRDAEGMEG